MANTKCAHIENEIENFADLLNKYESENQDNSTIINGIIVSINENEVYVDIKDKSEGVLNIEELMIDGKLSFKEQDEIKVVVIGNRAGKKLLSYKKALRKEKVVDFIKNYKEEEYQDAFEVKIIGKNKGGLIAVDENEVEYFLPRSQCNQKEFANSHNKKYKVKILKVDEENQSIVVSKKKVSDEERKKKKELLSNIVNGEQIKKGIVRKLTSYGMFVDVGGIDGLVHYSEISYKGPVNPSTMYKEGDEVLVKIIGFDPEKKHISLSIKAASQDPWEEIKNHLEVGDVLKVHVSNIENYGAFVDLGNDIEGFLHISEISWDKNIKSPKDYLNEGDEIDVEVIEIDFNQRRLRVSLKNLLPKPFTEFSAKYKVSDIVDGEVTSITSFGAFVKIDKIEGLLHNDDLSWTSHSTCTEQMKVGDIVKVKILRIDNEKQKISLSIKHLEESPSAQFAKKHNLGDILTGEVCDIKDFGIFVKLDDNVEALIKKEDLTSDEIKVGDKIEGALVFAKDDKLRLSAKKVGMIKTRENLEKINSDDKITIGDIIKDQLQ